VKDISIKKYIIILPGLALTGFRTTRARFQTIKKIYTIKERITATLNSYCYKNNNNNKQQQGSMKFNISVDITIKHQTKLIKNIFTVTKILNLRYLDLI